MSYLSMVKVFLPCFNSGEISPLFYFISGLYFALEFMCVIYFYIQQPCLMSQRAISNKTLCSLLELSSVKYLCFMEKSCKNS
jgi:hypothetical protein